MLQAYKFTEEDFRGERFKDYPTPLQGNNDLLSITQPEAIKTIHGKYFEAGTDDMREAPAIYVIKELVSRGAKIKAYDPKRLKKQKSII